MPLHFLHYFVLAESSHAILFCKKAALKNPTKFTEKHMCQNFAWSSGIYLEFCFLSFT